MCTYTPVPHAVWYIVSEDLIDTILGEKIKTNRSIGHKCRSFIRAPLIDFPVGNLTLMKWVGTNIHGPVITLTPSHPRPLRSAGGGGGLLGRDNCLQGGQQGRLLGSLRFQTRGGSVRSCVCFEYVVTVVEEGWRGKRRSDLSCVKGVCIFTPFPHFSLSHT